MGKKSKRQRPSKAARSSAKTAARWESIKKAGPRVQADHHIKMFKVVSETASHKEWSLACRHAPMRAFCQILLDQCQKDMSFVSEEDLQFLQYACNSGLSLNQARACRTMGVISQMNMATEDAIEYTQKAMQICDNASEEELEEYYFDPEDVEEEIRGCDLLYHIQGECRESLVMWRSSEANATNDSEEVAHNAKDTTSSLEDLRETIDFHKMEYIRLKEDTSLQTTTDSRIEQLKCFGSSLLEAPKKIPEFVTEGDYRFLKAVCKSSTEQSVNRAFAYWTRGQLFGRTRACEDACQCFQKAIQVCKNATEQERQESGGFLDSILEECQVSINHWTNTQLITPNPETGRAMPVSLSFLGGKECDACGKTVEDPGLSSWDCCSLCRLTYYCSRECQAGHWKEHKEVCRKPGEFKDGDIVYYLSAPPALDICGGKVRVVGQAPDIEGCFLVSCKYKTTEETSVADTKRLRRCRPALWNCDVEKKKAGI